jgi:phosphorylase/glycogen(starch) synthase
MAVKIIFMPVYLNGYDGLLNLPYYDVLSVCDLGVFPSHYEPWGYTALESASYCVPTVTTDLAGFGMWVKNNSDNKNKGIIILDYHERTHEQVIECLRDHIANLLEWSQEEITNQRKRARILFSRASRASAKALY